MWVGLLSCDMKFKFNRANVCSEIHDGHENEYVESQEAEEDTFSLSQDQNCYSLSSSPSSSLSASFSIGERKIQVCIAP